MGSCLGRDLSGAICLVGRHFLGEIVWSGATLHIIIFVLAMSLIHQKLSNSEEAYLENGKRY